MKVKTDLLYMTSNTTSEVLLNKIQGTSNAGTNTLISEEQPLMNLIENERKEIFSESQIPEFERKDKMRTRVIDETTPRIYFPKASNVEPCTQDLSASTTTPSKSIVPERAMEFKDKDEAINTQGFLCG